MSATDLSAQPSAPDPPGPYVADSTMSPGNSAAENASGASLSTTSTEAPLPPHSWLVYCLSRNQSAVESMLPNLVSYWVPRDALRVLLVDKSDLELNNVSLLQLRNCADLVVPASLVALNLEDAGWVALWPDRIKKDNTWVRNEKYPIAHARAVLEAFESAGFKPERLSVVERFGKAVVAIRVAPHDYVNFLQWADTERIVVDSLSPAPVSVATVTIGVADPKHPSRSQAIPLVVRTARARLEEKYKGMHWGRPDLSKSDVYCVQVTTAVPLTDADAFTMEQHGCRVAFSVRETGMRRGAVEKVITEAATAKVAEYKPVILSDPTDAQFEQNTVLDLVEQAKTAVSTMFDRWQGLRLSEDTCRAVVQTAFSVPLENVRAVEDYAKTMASFAAPVEMLRGSDALNTEAVVALRAALAEAPPAVPPSRLKLAWTAFAKKPAQTAAKQNQNAGGQPPQQRQPVSASAKGAVQPVPTPLTTQAPSATASAHRPTRNPRRWETVGKKRK